MEIGALWVSRKVEQQRQKYTYTERWGGVTVQQQPNKRTKYVQWVPSLKGKDSRNVSCLEGTGCGYNYIGN